jgi:hypothetical protein
VLLLFFFFLLLYNYNSFIWPVYLNPLNHSIIRMKTITSSKLFALALASFAAAHGIVADIKFDDDWYTSSLVNQDSYKALLPSVPLGLSLISVTTTSPILPLRTLFATVMLSPRLLWLTSRLVPKPLFTKLSYPNSTKAPS